MSVRYSESDYLAHEARMSANKEAKKCKPNEHALDAGPESKLHEKIATELKRIGWYFVRSRMDRRTTTAKGVPDFIIAAPGGRTFWIEAKTAKGKVRIEQASTLHWLGNLGHQSYVVRSFDEFLKVIKL